MRVSSVIFGKITEQKKKETNKPDPANLTLVFEEWREAISSDLLS